MPIYRNTTGEAGLRQAAQAASKGEWYLHDEYDALADDASVGVLLEVNGLWIAEFPRLITEARQQQIANAKFMAAANPSAILDLLDELDLLRAKVKTP